MSGSPQSDHWDLLASALGAEPAKKEPVEPPPEAAEPVAAEPEKPTVAEPPAVKATVAKASEETTPVAPPPAASPRCFANWDALAMELGVEVKPEPPPSAPPAFSPIREQAEKPPIVHAEHAARVGGPSAAQPAGRTERYKERGKTPADESGEASEKKSRHRRKRRHKDRDRDRPAAEIGTYRSAQPSETPDKADLDAMLSDVAIELAENAGVPIDEGAETVQSEKQPEKHHHSRRGSRRRKKRGGEGGPEKIGTMKEHEPPEQAAPGEEMQLAGVSAGAAQAADEDHEEGVRDSKSPFRAIPTWEEAINFIISKNMESRPRRQGDGAPRSRPPPSHKRRRK